jgi:hypothetical protein
MLKFEECKKTLNKNDENYSDNEIKLMIDFIDYWAKINAKTILHQIDLLNHEKSSNNGSRKQRRTSNRV